MNVNYEEAFEGFKEAIFWAEYVSTEESMNGCGDEGGVIEDFDGEISKESLEKLEAAFKDRFDYMSKQLEEIEGMSAQDIGADIYFTCAGHGVGFWDRGLGQLGKVLTEMCHHNRIEVYAWIDDNDNNLLHIEVSG